MLIRVLRAREQRGIIYKWLGGEFTRNGGVISWSTINKPAVVIAYYTGNDCSEINFVKQKNI